jgi:hypothetical protein
MGVLGTGVRSAGAAGAAGAGLLCSIFHKTTGSLFFYIWQYWLLFQWVMRIISANSGEHALIDKKNTFNTSISCNSKKKIYKLYHTQTCALKTSFLNCFQIESVIGPNVLLTTNSSGLLFRSYKILPKKKRSNYSISSSWAFHVNVFLLTCRDPVLYIERAQELDYY